MVNVSLIHGTSAHSAFAYVGYGVVVAHVTGEYERGHAFGRLGVDLVRRSGDAAEHCRVIGKFAAFLNNARAPFRSSVPLSREAVAAGLQSGEVQYANYWNVSIVKNLFHQGVELGRVLAEADSGITIGRKTCIRNGVDWQLPHRQAVRALVGHTRAPTEFDDVEFDEADFLQSVAHDPYARGLYQVLRLQLCYLFGDLDAAAALSASSVALLDHQRGTPTPVEHHFYTALTQAALCDRRPEPERAQLLASLREHHHHLEVLAANCPENYRSKERLLAAEIARVDGRSEAASCYDQAIEAASREHLLRDEALGNELAGRFFNGLGRRQIAARYLREALDGYTRWGASAKVRALEQEFAALDELAGASWTMGADRVRADRRGGGALDVLGILRAAETISGEVVLDRLLEKLMDVCVANAGAERGALLLEREGGMVLRVVGLAGEASALERTPLETAGHVPVALIQEVRRSGEAIVLSDAAGQSAFAADPYIAERQVRSALALPIRRRARAVGVLYLENNLATGVFTRDRLRVLELLSSQMAISLENSMLFERLTAEVHERTRAEAEAARLYHEAQRAVEVRDEFLSVASHELNTPMAALMLNLQALLRPGFDLNRDPIATQRMVRVAERQGHRLSRLIRELLDVTRIERGQLPLALQEVDLGQLVSEVVSHFALDLDRAGCRVTVVAPPGVRGWWDPMRLEQVLMNLMSNAAKFGAGQPIEILVAERGDTAILRVVDHGIGMDPEHQEQLFERFGRGVPVEHYGGLGLGLYVCRRIVEAHGGVVTVASTPGQGSTFTVELPRHGWRDRSAAVPDEDAEREASQR